MLFVPGLKIVEKFLQHINSNPYYGFLQEKIKKI